jgi:hypothetical protein
VLEHNTIDVKGTRVVRDIDAQNRLRIRYIFNGLRFEAGA